MNERGIDDETQDEEDMQLYYQNQDTSLMNPDGSAQMSYFKGYQMTTETEEDDDDMYKQAEPGCCGCFGKSATKKKEKSKKAAEQALSAADGDAFVFREGDGGVGSSGSARGYHKLVEDGNPSTVTMGDLPTGSVTANALSTASAGSMAGLSVQNKFIRRIGNIKTQRGDYKKHFKR